MSEDPAESQEVAAKTKFSSRALAELPKGKKPELVRPFQGEIIDYPGTGKIVVVIGYHSLEREWGQIIREQLQKNVIDKGQKVVFFEVQNSPVETGEESPVVDVQIARFLREIGDVEMVIDIHEHPGAQTAEIINSWSLTTEDEYVAEVSKGKIEGLRILPLDDYSRRKTGGENIPYAVSDPDLPPEVIEGYLKGNITSQAQKAVNDTVSFIVDLSNTQLESSSKKET